MYTAQGRVREAQSAQDLANAAFQAESAGRFDDARNIFESAEQALGFTARQITFCAVHTRSQVEVTLKAAATWKAKVGRRVKGSAGRIACEQGYHESVADKMRS